MSKRDKPNLPSKARIVGHWWEVQESQKSIEMPWGEWVDPGEPECMACHRYSEDWYNADDWKKRWERSSLQRCHVVGRQHGGSDEPSNLVLMCKRCHEDSPDTADPDVLFNWMKDRPKYEFGKFSSGFMAHAQKLTAEVCANLPGDLPLDRVSELWRMATQQALQQLSPGVHFGAGMTEGTYLALVSRAAEIANNMIMDKDVEAT